LKNLLGAGNTKPYSTLHKRINTLHLIGQTQYNTPYIRRIIRSLLIRHTLWNIPKNDRHTSREMQAWTQEIAAGDEVVQKKEPSEKGDAKETTGLVRDASMYICYGIGQRRIKEQRPRGKKLRKHQTTKKQQHCYPAEAL
jgi:squalene cyclase